MRVLMITSEYPTEDRPNAVPFIARQVDHLRRLGVEVDVFHFRGNKNLINYVSAWKNLRKHTKGKKFDLVHAQWGHSAALAFPKRHPWVITFRGNDLEGIIGKNGKPTLLGKILTIVSKLTGRIAEGVIVVSESLTRNLKRDDYHVIPSGLDLENFRIIPRNEAREFLGLPLNKKLVLFASSSRKNPRKRFELAREAVELVKRNFDAELIIATGVSHNLIPYYMNAADALILTSIHEGSPNVVKEALACNLPVVSVDVGDVKQRCAGIDGCIVCDNDSPDTIALALEEVLAKNSRIDGRRSVEELDERVIAQKVIEVYQGVLNQVSSKEVFGVKSARENLATRI